MISFLKNIMIYEVLPRGDGKANSIRRGPIRASQKLSKYPMHSSPFIQHHLTISTPSIQNKHHQGQHERTQKLRPRGKEMASTACFLHHQAPSTAASAATKRFQLLVPTTRPSQLVVRAQKQTGVEEDSTTSVSRRLALTVLIGAAAISTKVSPADASYGEAANVFGKQKTNTDFLPFSGDGFKLLIPSKWSPSKEVEYPGQVLRYEDSFDAVSNLTVIVTPTDKKSITDYGPPEQFLAQYDYLLGKQTFSGSTQAEGGFDDNSVAAANILETETPVIGGKKYYTISVLTRTADGDEGGRHQLINAAVADGKLYILKVQAGDKRWFKGARKFLESTLSSFNVA